MFPRKIVGGRQTKCIMGDVLVVNIATKLSFQDSSLNPGVISLFGKL